MYPKQKAKRYLDVLLFSDIVIFVPSDMKPLFKDSVATQVQFYSILI